MKMVQLSTKEISTVSGGFIGLVSHPFVIGGAFAVGFYEVYTQYQKDPNGFSERLATVEGVQSLAIKFFSGGTIGELIAVGEYLLFSACRYVLKPRGQRLGGNGSGKSKLL